MIVIWEILHACSKIQNASIRTKFEGLHEVSYKIKVPRTPIIPYRPLAFTTIYWSVKPLCMGHFASIIKFVLVQTIFHVSNWLAKILESEIKTLLFSTILKPLCSFAFFQSCGLLQFSDLLVVLRFVTLKSESESHVSWTTSRRYCLRAHDHWKDWKKNFESLATGSYFLKFSSDLKLL